MIFLLNILPVLNFNKMEKIQLIKEIRDCQLTGKQFDKFYTIGNSTGELEFALEWGQTQLAELALTKQDKYVS